jgi:asparagine synthetase A
MKTHQNTGEQFTENRKELSQEYFDSLNSVYEIGNMGIVTLLSDLQHQIAVGFKDQREKDYWNRILNNIKCVLIQDDRTKEMMKELKEHHGQ